MKPLVSIIIPAYNAQKWIKETITSALNQTWKNKEVIIVDDGSTDSTFDIASEFKSSNVKIVRQRNAGACQARNKALAFAQGDWIQWLDADDLIAPDKIELQLSNHEYLEDPEVLLSCSWGEFYYRPQSVRLIPSPLWQDLDAVDWLVLRLKSQCLMPLHSFLVSRRLTERAGPWNEKLVRNQDGEYIFRVVSRCRAVKFVRQARCYYRKANPGSITKNWSQAALESLYSSTVLTVQHVMNRDESRLTREACCVRLNLVANLLQDDAPFLARYLRESIKQLGGEITPHLVSKRYELAKKILGEEKARTLKISADRIRTLLYSLYDYCLAKLFGISW